MRRCDPVAPAVPGFLGNFDLVSDATEPARRITLARHLIHPAHPIRTPRLASGPICRQWLVNQKTSSSDSHIADLQPVQSASTRRLGAIHRGASTPRQFVIRS